jgi:hypothetical protein
MVAKWVIVFLSLGIIINLIAMFSTYAEINLLTRVIEGEFFTEEEIDSNDNRQFIIGITQALTFIVTTILFSIWVYRAYRNLSFFGARGLKHSEGWVVAYFYIPLVNLYRPYQAVKEIWQVSNPDMEVRSTAWQKSSTSIVLGTWWSFWLASVMINRAANRISLQAETLSRLREGDWLSLGANFLMLMAAVFATLVVRRINKMQNERYRRVMASNPFPPSEFYHQDVP